MALEFERLNTDGCRLRAIGTVQNVIKGIVPPDLAEQWVDATSFAFAFEIGSPKSLNSMGEMVAMNGWAYVKSTEDESQPLIAGQQFLTTGAFIIPSDVEPTWQVAYDGPLTLQELYDHIYDKVQSPFALVGTATAEPLIGTAIQRPPIFNEDIFVSGNFIDPPLEQEEANLALIGLCTNYDANHLEDINNQLDCVLYPRPGHPLAGIETHTHALTLKKPHSRIEQVTPKEGLDVYHLIPDTTITHATLKVYCIDSIER